VSVREFMSRWVDPEAIVAKVAIYALELPPDGSAKIASVYLQDGSPNVYRVHVSRMEQAVRETAAGVEKKEPQRERLAWGYDLPVEVGKPIMELWKEMLARVRYSAFEEPRVLDGTRYVLWCKAGDGTVMCGETVSPWRGRARDMVRIVRSLSSRSVLEAQAGEPELESIRGAVERLLGSLRNDGDVSGATVLDMGEYEPIEDIRGREVVNASEVSYRRVGPTTNRVPCRVGAWFGIRVRVDGEPAGAHARLTYMIETPNSVNSTPDTVSVGAIIDTVERRFSGAPLDIVTFVDERMGPGIAKFVLLCNERKLAEARIELVR